MPPATPTSQHRGLFLNLRRFQQALSLQSLIRQASLKSTENPGKAASRDHRVFNASIIVQVLARMMAQPLKPGQERNPMTITDTCFPNLGTLCQMTCLSDSTVRSALGNLIAWGFITKTRMPGFPHHKGKYKSRYEHCRYYVVPEIWDWSPPQSTQETNPDGPSPASNDHKIPSTSTPAEVLAADQAIANSLDAVPSDADAPAHRPQAELDAVDDIHRFLEINFGGHPTYKLADTDAARVMGRSVDECILLAGSPEVCLSVLQEALLNEKTRASVMKGTKLGGYILKSFPGWLIVHNEQRPTPVESETDQAGELMWSLVDAQCGTGHGWFEIPNEFWGLIPECLYRFNEDFGPHLGESAREAEDAHDGVRALEFQLTPAFIVANLLSQNSSQEITPDDLPFAANLDVVETLRWAVSNKPWADDLAAAASPADYLLVNLQDIAAAMSAGI